MAYPGPPTSPQQFGPPETGNRNRMWLIAIGVIAVAVIAAATAIVLVLQNRSDESPPAGIGADQTSEAPSSEEPSPEETTGGAAAETQGEIGESAGFNDETCAAFDLASFETVFGNPHDPAQNYTSSNDDDGYALLTCSFYGSSQQELRVTSSGWREPAATLQLYEDDRGELEADDGYKVTDLDLGEAGYRAVENDDERVEIIYHFVQGSLEVNLKTTINVAESDVAAADAMLAEISAQAVALLESYV